MFVDNIIYNRERRIQFQTQKIRRITSQFPLLLEKRKSQCFGRKLSLLYFVAAMINPMMDIANTIAEMGPNSGII
jgi:hypothetical protein